MDGLYRIYITPSARKETRKLPKQVREAALQTSRTLEREPYAGERLTGSLHMLYSLHFTAGQSQYRIAYTLDHPHQLVVVHLIHSRENFYVAGLANPGGGSCFLRGGTAVGGAKMYGIELER